MAAAEALGHAGGASTVVVLPHLEHFHRECERRAREALDAEEFEAARLEGCSLSFDEAVAYARAEATT
jgi:non-specific serine/threonine protein kinase